jgi:hypothetical protein
MSKKTNSLMKSKELAILKSGEPRNIKAHSPSRLKTYIALSRKLRDKYRDLNQRQKLENPESKNVRTANKAKIFGAILRKYERRFQQVQASDDLTDAA